MKQFFENARQASIGLSLLVFIGWVAGGCASSKQYTYSSLPADLTATEDFDPTKVRLAIGDVVIVRIASYTNQILPPTHTQTIKEDGNITLPVIGDLKAARKTMPELQREIHERCASTSLRNSVISVEREEFYYVGGQVQRPGRCHYLGPTTVTKAIESAGGFAEFAARRRVELTRTNGKKFWVDCRKIAPDASLDVPVYPGDKIHVLQGPPPRDFFQ